MYQSCYSSLFWRKDPLNLSMDSTTRYFLKQFYTFPDQINFVVRWQDIKLMLQVWGQILFTRSTTQRCPLEFLILINIDECFHLLLVGQLHSNEFYPCRSSVPPKLHHLLRSQKVSPADSLFHVQRSKSSYKTSKSNSMGHWRLSRIKIISTDDGIKDFKFKI